MKLNKIVAMFGLVAVFSAQVAMAQPSVVVEMAQVPVGTLTTDIDVTFTSLPGSTATAQFEVNFHALNSDLIISDISACVPNIPFFDFACSNPAPGVIRWVATPNFQGNLPDFSGVITLDLSAAQVDLVYPLVVQNEEYLDPFTDPVAPSGTMDGSVEVQSVPSPQFQLTHDGGGAGNTIDFGVDNLPSAANFTVNASVMNSGNDIKNNLTGECDITDDDGGVFSSAPDPIPFDLAPGGSVPFTMNCATDTPGVYMGVLTCNHNAPGAPSVYTLLCEEAPTPTYNDSPDSLSMGGDQGDGNPSDVLMIDNISGEPGSILTGSCALETGGVFSLPAGGGFSVAQGATQGVPVQCDGTAAPNFYNDALICTPDPSVSNPGTYRTPVSCAIDQPDPAVYVSTPYAAGNPGQLIDLNDGNPPPFATGPAPTTTLRIMNGAQPGDDFLDLMGCEYSGSGAITAAPALVENDLDPGQFVDVVFTCSTANPGTFTGTYTCPFDNNPTPPPPIEGTGGLQSPATYPVRCEVREQLSEVVEDPTSGTQQTADLLPNETADWDFTFTEVRNENLDATLIGCEMSDGADFAITTSTAYPQPIPAGGTNTVSVEFTDPGVGDTFTDTLECTFEHRPEPCVEGGKGGGCDEQVDVSWPFEVNVTGRNVTVRVTKDFDDDNPMGVDVFMECNTGLPLMQSGTVHDPDAGLRPGQFSFVEFVVVDFEPGEIDCDVYETVPTGYTQSYFAEAGENGDADSVTWDLDGCHYEGIRSSDFNCEITNTLDIVEVEVNKEWIDDNPSYQLPQWVQITLWCNAPIQNLASSVDQPESDLYSAQQYIDPSNPGLFGVYPDWDGSTTCYVTEEPEAGVDQDVSDCASIDLAPGQGGECTVVNTRLYAGIPTLSQYGLILMALMMLGVGMLAFRRYS